MDASSAATRAGRAGPVEGEQVIGCDRDRAARPGVPMRAPPARAEGAPPAAPVEQVGIERRTHRAGLNRPTPVFGTAQPLHGVSGALRRGAYRIPEHRARHWMLLMAADRVDVLEDRLGGLASAPLAAAGAEGAAARVRSNPLPYLAGAMVGATLVTAWRGRRGGS
jgi:hypothetical protein